MPCDVNGNDLPPNTQPPLQETKPDADWTPVDSQVQFELAEFLFKKTEMAETRVNELMQLWAASQVQDNRSPPFLNHDILQEQIDNISLSHVNWNSFSITYTGPLPLQNTPKWMTTEYEVWYRNPREVIHNILS